MKLVVNMMMGTMMTTLAEGLTLAQKADLDQKQLVEVLGLGVMNCPLFAMKVRTPHGTSPHCTSLFPGCFCIDTMPRLLPLLFGCVSIGFRRLLVHLGIVCVRIVQAALVLPCRPLSGTSCCSSRVILFITIYTHRCLSASCPLTFLVMGLWCRFPQCRSTSTLQLSH